MLAAVVIPTSSEVVAVVRHDFPTFVVGMILCTAGAGLVVFNRRLAARELLYSGLVAFGYGFRMLAKAPSAALLLDHPAWLPYVTASLEYLVPIPAALLFARYFGDRLRRLNEFAVAAFVTVAAVGIPYEIIRRTPYAAMVVEVPIVIGFVVLAIVNFALGLREHDNDSERRLTTIGAVIFLLFVINEHFRVVDAPFRLATEPVGFVIFLGTIIYALIGSSARKERRLFAVENELATARQIQQSILPKRGPAIATLDVASVYLPASSVGGDFFDFIETDDHRCTFLVADVSGHGVPAALVASMFKVAVQMLVTHAAEPARLLSELNAFFRGRIERQFITAVVAFVDGASGDLTIATAGHPPPFVRRADSRVEEVGASGPVLGRFCNARFAEQTLHLDPGDTLVLYTDGIPEAANAAEEQFGYDRLGEAIAQAGASAEGTADHVTAALRSWRRSDADLEDDVTLVVARRRMPRHVTPSE